MFELTCCLSQEAAAEIPALCNGFGTGNFRWLLILAERLAVVMIAQRAQDAPVASQCHIKHWHAIVLSSLIQ